MGGILTNPPQEVGWNDISGEIHRTYVFGPREGRVSSKAHEIRVTSPIRLHISKSGGHYIEDEAGTSHYIPCGWLHLYWDADPKFRFVT